MHSGVSRDHHLTRTGKVRCVERRLHSELLVGGVADGDILCDGLAGRHREVESQSAALVDGRSINVIHAQVIRRPQHQLGRIHPRRLGVERHSQLGRLLNERYANSRGGIGGREFGGLWRALLAMGSIRCSGDGERKGSDLGRGHEYRVWSGEEGRRQLHLVRHSIGHGLVTGGHLAQHIPLTHDILGASGSRTLLCNFQQSIASAVQERVFGRDQEVGCDGGVGFAFALDLIQGIGQSSRPYNLIHKFPHLLIKEQHLTAISSHCKRNEGQWHGAGLALLDPQPGHLAPERIRQQQRTIHPRHGPIRVSRVPAPSCWFLGLATTRWRGVGRQSMLLDGPVLSEGNLEVTVGWERILYRNVNTAELIDTGLGANGGMGLARRDHGTEGED
mmetsp:Transcript_1961/g.2982  ORF Transcript_1961/g.2982 Transcript_1961/m.2982 type:complete len:390 (-) Transcript_1961:209-1378(-)